VILMVELGDLREGIMLEDLPAVLACAISLPNIQVRGLGANLACRSGVVPDVVNMAVLDRAVAQCETILGRPLEVVSGGNSANLSWALHAADVGRVNDLRVGEAIMLGCDPLDRTPIAGLHQDAFTLVVEVIESGVKPSAPWGQRGQTAHGPGEDPIDCGPIAQSILAIGRQDTDPDGLTPPEGMTIIGCSSDHLLVRTARPLAIGSEVSFGLGYGALVRAMTSPFVARQFTARE
ncbi:MAG: alanine racemase, partial [Euzebya sp.]